MNKKRVVPPCDDNAVRIDVIERQLPSLGPECHIKTTTTSKVMMRPLGRRETQRERDRVVLVEKVRWDSKFTLQAQKSG